jgi:hypothetical protein
MFDVITGLQHICMTITWICLYCVGLGVTLSADLKWNNHIHQMTSKANKSLSFIRRNLQINSKSVKDRAYQSLVWPKLEYCCYVWDPYTTENINKIEQVQRRAARYACHRHHNTSSITEMIHSLDWPTLQERRLKTRLHIFYKIINNKIAVSYDNIIIPSQSRTKIYPFKYHQTKFYRCFRWYIGPRQSSSILVWVVEEICMLYLLQILN